MTAFDCQGSPNRSDNILTPHLFIRSDSTPSQPYFTPPDSPVEACGGQGRSWKGDWRRAKTPPVEEMEISGSAAMDCVEMISIMEEESNIITSNTSVLEEASSPIIVRLDAARTSVSLNRFWHHLMVVCHTLTNIPRVDFT
jgi:hypothetical protein